MINLIELQILIARLQLPLRKGKSKFTYSVYLLYHDHQQHYFGVTKNFTQRLKQHRKTKQIHSSFVLIEFNSLANAKIVECYLTLHYKLTTPYLVSNQRTESCLF